MDDTDNVTSSMTELGSRIANYLDGAAFPSDKDALVAHASQRDAPDEVLTALDNLPDKSYGSLSEVVDEVKNLETEMV